MGRPRKYPEIPVETPETPRKAKGNDAVVTVSLETTQGIVTRIYRIPGFLGNTLGWQRSGKGLDDILIPSLQAAFGGQVRVE